MPVVHQMRRVGQYLPRRTAPTVEGHDLDCFPELTALQGRRPPTLARPGPHSAWSRVVKVQAQMLEATEGTVFPPLHVPNSRVRELAREQR